MQDSLKKPGLGTNPLNPLLKMFGRTEKPVSQLEPQPGPTETPVLRAVAVKVAPPQLKGDALPVNEQPPLSGQGRDPLKELRSKRTERITLWLTPEEREEFKMLAEAEKLTESTLARMALLQLMEKRAELIRRVRAFREGLAKSG